MLQQSLHERYLLSCPLSLLAVGFSGGAAAAALATAAAPEARQQQQELLLPLGCCWEDALRQPLAFCLPTATAALRSLRLPPLCLLLIRGLRLLLLLLLLNPASGLSGHGS